VRELDNLMGRAALLAPAVAIDVVLGRELGAQPAASLPAATMPAAPGEEDLRLQPQVDALEQRLILRALELAEGNKAKAARALEISERTLWYKLKKFDLS